MLKVGDYIGSYRILDKIGEGGMNIVYRAINDKAGKMWAVKECKKGIVDKFGMKAEQFLATEVEVLKNLKHENLPSIVDVFDDENGYIIVMDYVEGFTLAEYLERNLSASEEQVVHWGLQLCNVLDYLHRQDPPIIYRDMKPENVMLKPDGNVVLIDFGTSRHFKFENKLNDTTMLGTRAYASPEAFGGKGQTDVRSDIFSLGATLYHLITGHNPAMSPFLAKPIQDYNGSLSAGLNNVIMKCVAQDPNARYQNCGELHYALTHYKEQDISYRKKLKKKMIAFLTVVSFLILSLAGSFVCYSKGNALKESTYDSFVEDAVLGQTLEDKLASYREAIRLEPSNEKGYQGILDLFMEDNVLTSDEDTYLREMFASKINNRSLDELFSENTSAYSEFAYSLAMDYWYYYGFLSSDGSIESMREYQVACRWFNKVSLYDDTNAICKNHYENAQTYAKIGSYYASLGVTNLAGDTEISYSTYFTDLLSLYQSGGDNEITALYLEKEIVYQIIEHANDYRAEGMPQDTLTTTLNDISDKVAGESGNSDLSSKLISDISASIDLASKSINSAYSHSQSESKSRFLGSYVEK